MSKDIRIKKGLDIKLQGEAEKIITNAVASNVYTIQPENFHGIIPKLIAKTGTKIKAGEPLFYNKSVEKMMFVSPVSGEVIDVVRGEKRKIVAVKIKADKEQSYQKNKKIDISSSDGDSVKNYLLSTGSWPFIKQRPYDIIANPEKFPKAIFISGYTSAPLSADYDFVLRGKEAELQAAVTALGKLTEGAVHVSVGANSKSPFSNIKGISLHKVSGPHPSGNVGVQISKIDPLNKGEIAWTISPQDLVIIGELILTGIFNAERIVAVGGSVVKKPKYYRAKIGAEVSTMIYDAGVEGENFRVISGNVLTGVTVKPDGFLGYYDNTITLIPEGNDYELFGWNKPIFNKLSTTRALTFSWLNPKKKYDLTTNTNGEHRAFVLTGKYEEVFPFDIYPMQILKACLYEDLDEMEALGMYEVAPEDFALTEFVCVSKQPHQEIIRKGLDLMIKEIG